MSLERALAADPATMVDWAAAGRLAGRLSPPGPAATRADLDDLVGGLRDAAQRAVPHVLAVTGMAPADGNDDALGAVYVVDRTRWAVANTAIMAAMLADEAVPVATGAATNIVGADEAAAGSAAGGSKPAALPAPVVAAGTAEVGSVLALLSSRVLGQFDPYSAQAVAGPGAGQLLLVAPNVLAAERSMHVDAADFRLWVCLHEQTHALQFARAPWLADHLRERSRRLTDEVTDSSRRLATASAVAKLRAAGRAVRGALSGEGGSLVDGLLTAPGRRALEDLTAVMALLEGHADVAMDAVGRGVVPSVERIRDMFEKRRDGAGRGVIDVVVRRLIGMEAKIAQYRDGAAFVRAVTDRVGQDGLNAVWDSPQNLPTAAEMADPATWVRRVHG